jgi:hypothetical protein
MPLVVMEWLPTSSHSLSGVVVFFMGEGSGLLHFV